MVLNRPGLLVSKKTTFHRHPYLLVLDPKNLVVPFLSSYLLVSSDPTDLPGQTECWAPRNQNVP